MSELGYSDRHSHEPEIPPAWSEDGRCLICSMRVELDAARAEATRYKKALTNSDVNRQIVAGERNELRAEVARLKDSQQEAWLACDERDAEVVRLEAELARTPVRLTADEAAKVRQVLAAYRSAMRCSEPETVNLACLGETALALLAPAGKDKT